MRAKDVVSLYDRDVVILKDYRIKRKITLHRSIRKSGFESDKKITAKGTVNSEKLEDNIIRAKSKIFELAYCNQWDWFITLTIDEKKHDRKNLDDYMQKLSQWFRNYRKQGIFIKYLLVPEMHKDGSWHCHGFLMGLPEDQLYKNDNGYLDWKRYKEKFGFCSIDKIKNHEAISKYITKYISKDLKDCVKELGGHMYYCSKSLKRAETIKRGTLTGINIPWDFENDWIKCKWYHDTAEALETIIL